MPGLSSSPHLKADLGCLFGTNPAERSMVGVTLCRLGEPAEAGEPQGGILSEPSSTARVSVLTESTIAHSIESKDSPNFPRQASRNRRVLRILLSGQRRNCALDVSPSKEIRAWQASTVTTEALCFVCAIRTEPSRTPNIKNVDSTALI